MVHFLSFSKGYPGDIGPPGQNGPVGPTVSRLTCTFFHQKKWGEFIPQYFLHRECKGQEVYQVQQEHLEFRWVYLYLIWKWNKYLWNVFSFQLLQLSFHQGDEGLVGPAGPTGAEVSADWISPATQHQSENKITLQKLSHSAIKCVEQNHTCGSA